MFKLGDVCEIVNGGTPDTSVKKYWDGDNFWITPKDMGKLTSIFVDSTLRKITDAGLKNSSAKLLPVESVILSSRAPIGHLAVNKVPLATNQGCKGLVPKEGLHTLYLYYFLSNSVELLNSLGTGATFKELSGSKLSEVEIPLPPLPEQRRIVSILDEAFAAIAKSKANAEKNLQNAKELFESYLQMVFVDKTHGPHGESLDELCELIVDCEHKTAPVQDTGFPSIRTPNIGKGFLILDGVNRVSEKTYKAWTRRAIPRSGDLILAREAPAGNVAVIPDGMKVCLGQRTVLIRPNHEKLNSKYLAFLLLSRDVQEQLLSHSRGATVAHINMKDIRAFKIYNIAPLEEQNSVVDRLESMSSDALKLESMYRSKLNKLEELKKSILQRAFSDELRTTVKEFA